MFYHNYIKNQIHFVTDLGMTLEKISHIYNSVWPPTKLKYQCKFPPQ